MRYGELKIDENNFNEKIPFYCEIHNEELIKNFKNYTKTLLISKNEKENNNTKNTKEKNGIDDNKEIKM